MHLPSYIYQATSSLSQQGYKSNQIRSQLQQLISALKTKSINVQVAIKSEIKLTESNKIQIRKQSYFKLNLIGFKLTQ